jgi:hypothetical protein
VPPTPARCGLLVLDRVTGDTRRAFVFPYVPEQLERSLVTGPEGGLCETVSLAVDLDATDGLERGDRDAVRSGIEVELAALVAVVREAAAEDALALLVWGAQRLMPIRVEELAISESAFDGRLNAVRARVLLRLTVEAPGRLGPAARRALRPHLERERRLATRGRAGLQDLGLDGHLRES